MLTYHNLFKFIDLQAQWNEPLSVDNHVFSIEAHHRCREGRTSWDDMCVNWDLIRLEWARSFRV